MYTKIEDLKASKNEKFQSLNIRIKTEEDLGIWLDFLKTKPLTIEILGLYFTKNNLQKSSSLAKKASELFQYIAPISSLRLYTFIDDYALKSFLDNPHLATITDLSFINSSRGSLAGLNPAFFEIDLVNYLHKNQHLKTLHISEEVENLKASQSPNLKEAMIKHPTLCNFSQWIPKDGDLLNDPDLLYSFKQKKVADTTRETTLDERYKLLISDLRILFGAFEDPYIREHNTNGWQDAEKNIDEEQKNWQSFLNSIETQKDDVEGLETKKRTAAFAFNILLLLKKVVFLEKRRRNSIAPDFLNEFWAISNTLLTNISSKLAANSDLSSELVAINGWLERFKTAPDEDYQPFQSKKYFIYTETLYCVVSVENLLALISDKNPNLVNETTYPKITFGENLHVSGYEQVSKESLHQHNCTQIPIQSMQCPTTPQTNYSSILEKLNLTRKHLSDEQIISIIDSFIDTIYHVHPTKIDEFLVSIFHEISLREDVTTPDIESIYQKKITHYVNKELLRSLKGQSNYSHQEKKIAGKVYSENESINELIQEDVDHSSLQYEINTLRLELCKLLVRHIVIFHSATELATIITDKLQQLPEKIKHTIWPRFNTIKRNEKLSDAEKIVRYFFLLYEAHSHTEIQDLLKEYFFIDRKPLFSSYSHTLGCDKSLAAYNNVAEVLKTYLLEYRPSLYSYLLSYAQKNASRDIDGLLLFAEACHQMMTKGTGFGLFNNSLKKEMKLEHNLFKALTCFYLGEIPIEELTTNVSDLIKDSIINKSI